MNPTPEEANKRREFIKENFYTMSNSQMGKILGIAESNIRKHAKRLGLPPKSNLLTKSDLSLQATSLFANRLAEQNLPTNWTYGWLKSNEASIFVKNPEDILRLEDLKNEWLQTIKSKAPTYKPFQYKKIEDPHLLVIDPADVHIGKLALSAETGEDYNVDIAIKRVKDGIEMLVQKAQGFPIEKVLLVIGNDILHTDTTIRTTTKGTPQDTDGMWFENYKKAHDLYVQVIDVLTTIAPVHVIHCPSNHDVQSGFYLAQSVEAYYNKNKNVTFDVSIAHRKYFQYGKNLLGFSHGDGAKETDMMHLMAHESKELWANTDYRYWYLHHRHHMSKIQYRDGKDYIGGTIEYLRAVSANDGWHNRNGYVAPQSIYAFLHQKNKGQIARIMHHY